MKANQIKKIANELDHILGLCKCTPRSKKCAYWKIVDKPNPGKAQKDAILKLIKESTDGKDK